MLFDVAHRLRVDGKSWKHPLVIVAIIFSSLACMILLVQIFMLGINHKIDFPAKWMFISGVVVAMLGDGSMFTYTFKPLIYWRKNRMNEGYSRTTALGIWYYMIQNIWYVCFGAVYVWFFIKNSWDYFPTMLAMDYALRFIENLLYTWPPPACFIDYVTSLLPSNSIHLSTRAEGSHVMSSERYNKEATVEYGDTIKPAAASTNSTYGSKVTIMT
ncbi:uncharacterized protein EV154DRAFT_422630 [Mucor mucedo]|uniref:uncharacterized protein n=1 Tax=Mucor mucedo TaxID=29922 RepID=UPI00221F1421|nr:uncharacterized protein EV154DRAFT_422630 [Mucor mucedo]KAI7890083.1 hypothetical protein EV154DRAFT_422630 [Mucor mucedo]